MQFIQRFAPALFVFLWSTGFIGSKYGLAYTEPYTSLCMRMVLTLGVLWILLRHFRPVMPDNWTQRGHLMLSGLLLHGLYLGGVFSAIKGGMSTGLTALLVGLQPVLIALLAPWWLHERVTFVHWLGVLLGAAGLYVVLGADSAFEHGGPHALLVAMIALLGITSGALYQKRYCAHHDLLTIAFFQYLPTVVLFALGSLLFETRSVTWNAQLVLALLWLTFALSICAILLLSYLIKHGEASKVTSLFYLVPPATAIEAYLLFDEPLGLLKIAGMGLVACGVYLVMRPRG